MADEFSRLAAQLGYEFTDADALTLALTHRSYGASNNERLEFLGDAVLGSLVTHALYTAFPAMREGDLSRQRAALVRQDALAEIAERIGLGSFLLLGSGERAAGGAKRPSILADALEAVIGAVYLDGGYHAAQAVVSRLFRDCLSRLDPNELRKDAKTELQEVLQARRFLPPRYSILATRGEEHQQEFDAACEVDELALHTSGTGRSRRIAEQEAARHMLILLKGTLND